MSPNKLKTIKYTLNAMNTCPSPNQTRPTELPEGHEQVRVAEPDEDDRVLRKAMNMRPSPNQMRTTEYSGTAIHKHTSPTW